jgi:hypothetical protein
VRYVKDLLLDSPIYVGAIVLAVLWQHGYWLLLGAFIFGVTIAIRDSLRDLWETT